jgi:DNA-nicking Smr family endonuclease
MDDDMSVYEIDLHGLNMSDAKVVLDEVFEYMSEEPLTKEVHIVVGVGKGSSDGPVLPSFVGNYVRDKGYKFELANGVLVVYLRHG